MNVKNRRQFVKHLCSLPLMVNLLQLILASDQQQRSNSTPLAHNESPRLLLRIKLVEVKLSLLINEVNAIKTFLIKYQHWNSFQDPVISSNRANVPLGPLGERDVRWRRSLDSSSGTGSAASYLHANRGERGEPGRNGIDGIPGLEGAPGLDGVPGVDGRNGKDGLNGRDGRDGKDGAPGERGLVGPPGPAGEMGRRGKVGPPGKTGPPGLPGTCAYKAKVDCSLLSNQTNSDGSNIQDAILIAPAMIGQDRSGDQLSNDERQVSVNEGDNIQLSCDAFGQPKPDYLWQRSDRKSTILMDVSTNLQVTSFFGSQLPLLNVDRVQAGNYECIASNGVPPTAVKRIVLNVNYAPTIRIFPGPSYYKVKLGSSILVECIVDANPSSFTYWMFASVPIMSLGPNVQETEMREDNLSQVTRHKKYIITESAGQLTNGAYYSILTLNITNIERDDLGLYKCISKNLIAQSIGHFTLDESGNQLSPSNSVVASEEVETKFLLQDALLKQSLIHERLDFTLGWPEYLMKRDANYSTFGDENRPRLNLTLKRQTTELISPRKVLLNSLISSSNETKLLIQLDKKNPHPSNSNQGIASTISSSVSVLHQNQTTDPLLTGAKMINEGIVETGMCIVEKMNHIYSQLHQSQLKHSNSSLKSTEISLLDQMGKPVYVGSISDSLLNWWSADSSSMNNKQDKLSTTKHLFYSTSPKQTDRLFEYESLTDLLTANQLASFYQESQRYHKLKHPLTGNSHLIYNASFFYVSYVREPAESLQDLLIVMYNLLTGDYRYLKIEDVLRNIEYQAFSYTSSKYYQLNRVELALDENGIWLIIPTIERKSKKHEPRGVSSIFDLEDDQKIRRLHVFQLDWSDNIEDNLVVRHNVSMRLDWRLIGQIFIIDGVLYGIKDRHLYSSKLQFAYDLYRCKLLSPDYLGELHRTFTNHFGNTQMIRYNPSEPKRFYTIDNSNLLWCPVKLIKTNPNDIWQQQPI